MALISKIREKTALVVGVVAVGLILFILGGDLLMGNSSFLNGRDDTVGEIASEEIKYESYQQAIEEVRYNFIVNTGRNPTEREMEGIRQQAWDKLIAEIAFTKEFDKLGLQVTENELVDMVQGNNITPEIQQAFTNPETGEFNRDQVVSYLQNLPQLPQQQQVAWQLFESNLNDGRLRLKFDNLMLLSDYVTDKEAKQRYELENTVAEVKYLYVPFYAISDSAVNVTDEQLKEYINNHKEEFEVEEGRTIRYVTFPFTPSAQDSAYFREELSQLKENFAKATNDSAFASINTDATTGAAYRTYTPGELPSQLADSMSSLSEGEIYGPYLEDDSYKMYKVSEIKEDTVSYTRARHILFKTEEGNEAEVRKQAQDVLNQIKKGADFAEMAQQYGQDGTASQGGDLGWFPEGRMVEPFEKAVFAQNAPGLINQLVQTDYGYHIIEVTEPKTNKVYKVATVESVLYPSDETRDQAFRKADYFASVVDDADDFEEAAKTDSLNVGVAENISPNAQTIRELGNAREVVRWAYNDASVASVSPVFELENAYVVATLTDKTEKGTAELKDVRDEVTAKVKAKLKGEQIIQKLKGLSGSLDEIAKAYGQDANIYSTSDLKLSSNALPNVGSAPEAIGKAFALKAGEVSEPIAGENGVIMIQTEAITQAPEIADYSSYKDQIRQQQRQQSSFNIAEAIEDFADIEDQRYKFY